ncbi:MAG TPA: hypothetical protein PLA94_30425 [Myxococcota bacterium]|nr:hypothetical protein [Myxococcota bacterium]
MWLLLLACTAPEEVEAPADIPCDNSEEKELAMAKTITFARRDEQGRTIGFDLDGRISEASDSKGCFKPDLVSPDGTPGIDSAFSGLVPALEATEARAVEGLIQVSINNGELLVGLELDDRDDLENDSCVDLTLSRGKGTPMLGTDGYLEAGQTFERNPDFPAAELKQVVLEDGAILAGPFKWSLPLTVLDAYVNLEMESAYLYYQPGENGNGYGYIGGGISVPYFVELMGNINSDVGEILISVVIAAADLQVPETGACDQLSAVIEFTTTPAFYFEDSTE